MRGDYWRPPYDARDPYNGSRRDDHISGTPQKRQTTSSIATGASDMKSYVSDEESAAENLRISLMMKEINKSIDQSCGFARTVTVRPRSDDLAEAIRDSSQEEFLHDNVIQALFEKINDSGIGSDFATAFAMLSAGLRRAADAKVFPSVVGSHFDSPRCLPEEVTSVSKPGRFIRAYQLEFLQDGRIGFGDPSYVFTPSEPGHHKLYMLSVLWTADGYIYGCVFRSKQHKGYASLRGSATLNHRPVYAVEQPGGPLLDADLALFTKGMQGYLGSMPCLEICRVKMTQTIYKVDGTWTKESAVRVHDAVLANEYVKHGMASFLETGFEISDTKAEQYRLPDDTDRKGVRTTEDAGNGEQGLEGHTVAVEDASSGDAPVTNEERAAAEISARHCSLCCQSVVDTAVNPETHLDAISEPTVRDKPAESSPQVQRPRQLLPKNSTALSRSSTEQKQLYNKLKLDLKARRPPEAARTKQKQSAGLAGMRSDEGAPYQSFNNDSAMYSGDAPSFAVSNHGDRSRKRSRPVDEEDQRSEEEDEIGD